MITKALLVIILAAWVTLLPFREGLASAVSPVPGTLRLGFVGDILLTETVGDLIKREGPDAPWEGVKELLSSYDLTCGNLECPVGTTGTPIPDKTWTFRADPGVLPGLVNSGFDVVSLANNHALDYGSECLLEGIGLINDTGIATIGAGANEQEARKPFILEKNGIKVGILAALATVPDPSWAATADRPGLAVNYPRWYVGTVGAIEALREQVDIVIVIIHWGDERTPEPVQWIAEMHSAMLDAGANAIIGAHPHVLHGVRYDGHTVTAYSLGNFVFTTRPENPALQIGAILTLDISKEKIEAASLVPTEIVWGKTYVLDGAKKDETIANLALMSKPFRTDVDADGTIVPLLFADMDNHWSRFTIGMLAARGSVNGYEDGTYRPENKVTKGEFAAMFSRAVAGAEAIEQAIEPEEFILCSPDSWAYRYLKYLASEGAIPGADPTWTVDNLCTRAEACSAMWNYAGQPLETIGTPSASSEPITGPDAATAPDDGYVPSAQNPVHPSIQWATSTGLLRGYPDGDLRLLEPVSRAEMAVLLSRFLSIFPNSR